jgi:hypothetical protein
LEIGQFMVCLLQVSMIGEEKGGPFLFFSLSQLYDVEY